MIALPIWSKDSIQFHWKSPQMILGFNELILKFMWRGKRHRIVKIIQKKNIVGRLILPTLRFTTKLQLSRLVMVTAGAAAAKSLRSCPTLCDPIDGSPPGSPVPGILQARILEWVAISFSNACTHAKSLLSCLSLWDPMDSSPPGSSVNRILQARILEWLATAFSK